MPEPAAKIVYRTTSDGTVLASRHWRPEGEPRGTVVLLHGIVSHGGWYEATGQALAERGFDVHLADRRGSGLNSAAPPDLAHWSVWRDDVLDHLSWIGQGRVVLCGISWGAKLAAITAAAKPRAVAGLGLLNPGIYAYQSPNPAMQAALALSRWLPVDRRVLGIPLKDPALFTDSRHWQDYVARDPLARRTITVREAREDLELTERARGTAPSLTMPVLVALSGRDRITDNEATRAFLSRVASADKTVLEYPSAAHTLDFEPDPARYHRDLALWIDRIFSAYTRS